MRSAMLSMVYVVATALTAVTLAAAAPEIHSVTLLTPQAERYGRVEVSADITGAWSNPFDPDQIAVDASFTAPSGRRVRVPGFWCQDYTEGGPAARVRAQTTGLTLFAYAHEWPEGTKLDLFVDDICLLDERGGEVPFDDMEQGDEPRAEGVDGAQLAFSTELVHGGARSLRFTPTLAGGQHCDLLRHPVGEPWLRAR
jgi:hypothetical protein